MRAACSPSAMNLPTPQQHEWSSAATKNAVHAMRTASSTSSSPVVTRRVYPEGVDPRQPRRQHTHSGRRGCGGCGCGSVCSRSDFGPRATAWRRSDGAMVLHAVGGARHSARRSCGERRAQKAEREGFEPSNQVSPVTRLAGGCLQPLGHLSGQRHGSRSRRSYPRCR